MSPCQGTLSPVQTSLLFFKTSWKGKTCILAQSQHTLREECFWNNLLLVLTLPANADGTLSIFYVLGQTLPWNSIFLLFSGLLFAHTPRGRQEKSPKFGKDPLYVTSFRPQMGSDKATPTHSTTLTPAYHRATTLGPPCHLPSGSSQQTPHSNMLVPLRPYLLSQEAGRSLKFKSRSSCLLYGGGWTVFHKKICPCPNPQYLWMEHFWK